MMEGDLLRHDDTAVVFVELFAKLLAGKEGG